MDAHLYLPRFPFGVFSRPAQRGQSFLKQHHFPVMDKIEHSPQPGPIRLLLGNFVNDNF